MYKSGRIDVSRNGHQALTRVLTLERRIGRYFGVQRNHYTGALHDAIDRMFTLQFYS